MKGSAAPVKETVYSYVKCWSVRSELTRSVISNGTGCGLDGKNYHPIPIQNYWHPSRELVKIGGHLLDATYEKKLLLRANYNITRTSEFLLFSHFIGVFFEVYH